MWPFDKGIILNLAEKEWLGRTPIKEVRNSVVAKEAEMVMTDLLGVKKQSRSEIKRVFS